MKRKLTKRRFAYYTFKDCSGDVCSVQKSSTATQDRIWLGPEVLKVQRFTPGKGWEEVELLGEIVGNNRMHLNRRQVKALLPILQKFAEIGEI